MRYWRRPAQHHGTKRRRVHPAALVWIVLLVFGVPVTLLGIQTWNIVVAVAGIQDVAVVPLPDSTTSERNREPDIDRGQQLPVQHAGTASRRLPLTTDGASAGISEPDRFETGHAQTVDRQSRQAGGGPIALSDWDVARTIAAAATERGDPLQAEIWNGSRAITILVLGIDRRADGGDQNADTIILATLDLTSGAVRAVSIPRDLLVPMPDGGEGKINGVYDAGVRERPGDPVAGVVAVRDTVEALFGVPIDHYVLVDFSGFESVVDAAGGIEITVPGSLRDDAYPTEDYGTQVVEFEPGRQHMNGERALQYARIRNPDDDDRRRERQFQVLVALLQQGQRFGSISKAAEAIVALGGAAQTSFTLEEQLALTRIAMDTDASRVTYAGLGPPDVTAGWTADGAWVYQGDPAAMRAFVQSALRA